MKFALATILALYANTDKMFSDGRNLGKKHCSDSADDFIPCSERTPQVTSTSSAKICPGYSRCNCKAGPGEFLECLSGGVTERCMQCKSFSECNSEFGKHASEEWCGCRDSSGGELPCVDFDFPQDCITACDNGRAIPVAWRDACRCHFTTEMECTPDKCFDTQLYGDTCGIENNGCRCFCQSFFKDFGGPHSNCVENYNLAGKASNLLTCPHEGLDVVHRLPADCGNGIIEEDEDCDGEHLNGRTCNFFGRASGVVACKYCQFDISGCFTCGNNVLEGPEQCDSTTFDGQTCATLGFSAGVLACDGNCQLDTSGCTSCGNGVVDEGEVCDVPSGQVATLANLDGKNCGNEGFNSGTLACAADCMSFVTSSCSYVGGSFYPSS